MASSYCNFAKISKTKPETKHRDQTETKSSKQVPTHPHTLDISDFLRHFDFIISNFLTSNRICGEISPKLDRKAHINPFVPNAPFLYPLKTSENLTVF